MEIELKYALANRGEFDRLLAHLQNYAVEKQTVLSQTNTFFDTPSGLLQKAGFILRLRAENDRFVLTAKGDAPADRTGEGVLTCRLEEEAEVPEAVAQHILAGKQDPLAALSARQNGLPQAGANQPKPLTQLLREAQRTEQLQPWGEFTNIRRVLPIKIGAHRFFFECDETRFASDRTDYEIEIELEDKTHASVVNQFVEESFAELHIQKRSTTGKAVRFFQQNNGTPKPSG